MNRDVHIGGLGQTSYDACYRAMDWLHAVRAQLERLVYDMVADLLNLEAALLFFEATSTYLELEEADEDVLRDWRGEKAGPLEKRLPNRATSMPAGQTPDPCSSRAELRGTQGQVQPAPALQAGRAVPAIRGPPADRRPVTAIPRAMGAMVAARHP
jgi:hypothetical protein